MRRRTAAPMREITVYGSVNVDLVVSGVELPGPGETVIGGRFEVHPGGKGANQAVAAARAGAPVRFIGCIGDDEYGHLSREALVAEGIDVSGLMLCDRPTGVGLIVVDPRGEVQIAVASGANELARCRGEHDILLTQLETPLEGIGGRTKVLNPAPARPVELSGFDWVIPNRGEASLLTGEEDPLRAEERLLDLGAGRVVITLGAGGVLHQGRLQAAFPARPVDTTGAGDTFIGAFVAALACERTDPLRFAQAAASLAVERPGARGAPTLAEIEARLDA